MAEERGSTTHDLPAEGEVEIGRALEAGVRIDAPSISRRHAVLHIGARLELEDVGSANGTFVHGERIAAGRRVELHPGDFFEVGSVVCAVRGGGARARARELRPHGYFDARLQEQVGQARKRGGELGVVRISWDHDDAERVGKLLELVSSGDVVAQYAPCEYELLLLDAPARKVAAVAAEAEALFDAVVGFACFPGDGGTADEVFAAACDAARADDEVEIAAGDIVVEDAEMKKLHALLPRVGKGAVNTLLLGETGVGKEIFAERLHALSPRAGTPLMRLNCAAFTDTLLESELFGHEKGAFTGAAQRKVGLIESASGGAVFLDEVGEMDLGIQAKLLRVIESGRLRRVGGTAEIDVDVVYISATNRDLQKEIEAGRFRSDLFFRLNGFSLTIPPLRERTGEILPLALRFARAAAQRMGESDQVTLTDAAKAALTSYRWPGNIRELRNMMERAVLLSAGAPIGMEHLALQGDASDTVAPVADAFAGEAPEGLTDKELAERQRILAALQECRGNQTRAATQLGISRRWLSTKMARYRIPRAREG